MRKRKTNAPYGLVQADHRSPSSSPRPSSLVNVLGLAQFYQRYLVRKDVATMTNETSVYPTWPATCYFLGLAEGDQGQNPGVVQEIGWQSMYGGMGLYNPISKNPVTDINKESGGNTTAE